MFDDYMSENIEVPIENEMQKSYIDYAMSVIVGRALPDARDGLKPAQRRILYAMYQINNLHDQPTKKSARIVGEVIGKYHPHGDAAAYETLVRMAQNFSMNYMLVEGQGNMGSIDGDPPAAQRYTEVRLRRIAEDMLEDLDKDAVPFVPNFDNTEREPVVLPSKLPNLLINGSSGIAVGVATNILPHNLGEVSDAIIEYINNKDATSEDLLKFIKGPDFPTGGIVFDTEDLRRSYLTGRGTVTIRARYHIENIGKRNVIIVTEIPYTVNKATLIQKIGELVKDKIITSISALRDESDKKGIRIYIEVKNDVDPEFVMNLLYKHTQLQISLPVMNIAVMGNRLLTLNIRNFIKIFVEHRISVVRNRTAHDLKVAEDRLHIVKGLLIAISDIDSIINTIKSSSDTKAAREAIMSNFNLSEKQSNAILDMKLSKLTNLEKTSLEAEDKTLTGNIEYYNKVLSDENEVYSIIKEETESVKSRYSKERATSIEPNVNYANITNEDLIKDEENLVLLTKQGYLKRVSASEYRTQRRGGKGVRSIDLKEGDFVKRSINCMSKDYLLFITSLGKVHWLKAYGIPETGRYSSGKAAVNLVNLGENEQIVEIINTRTFEGKFIIFITEKGIIKKTKSELFSHPRSKGIRALALRDGDSLVDVVLSTGDSNILIITKKGLAVRFKESGFRPLGRNASGVIGIRLREGDSVRNVITASDSDLVFTFTEHGYGKATVISEYRLQRRGGVGVRNLKVTQKTGDVVIALCTSLDSQFMLTSMKGVAIQVEAKGIRKTGRNASGVRVMKIEKDDSLATAMAIEGKEDTGEIQPNP